MKQKFLLIPAFAVVALAAYTLTLSYTNTPSLINQLEALANGEGGENGDGETGGTGENDNSGEGNTGNLQKKKDTIIERKCPVVVEERVYTEVAPGVWDWVYYKIPTGEYRYLPVIQCEEGGSGCTPHEPC